MQYEGEVQVCPDPWHGLVWKDIQHGEIEAEVEDGWAIHISPQLSGPTKNFVVSSVMPLPVTGPASFVEVRAVRRDLESVERAKEIAIDIIGLLRAIRTKAPQ